MIAEAASVQRRRSCADNQLAASAGWDLGLLALEFKDLFAIDLKLDLAFGRGVTGFAAADIDRLVEGSAEHEGHDEDAVPDSNPKVPPVTRLGNLWILDEHRLVCGDARDAASSTAVLGHEHAAMSISDAP